MTTRNENIDKHIVLNNKFNFYGIEGKEFPITFILLKVSGAWLPTNIRFRLFGLCYQIYSVLCVMCQLTYATTVVLNNALYNKSISELIECWYLLVVLFIGVIKFSNIFFRRSAIIRVLCDGIMEDRWRILQDEEEIMIYKHSKYSENFLALIYGGFVALNDAANVLSPLIKSNTNYELITEAYLPCDINIPSCFWIFYILQSFGYVLSSTIHIAYDCLIFNFIHRVCSQLRIFQHRLRKLSLVNDKNHGEKIDILKYEKIYLKKCFFDHYSINTTVKELNEIFYEVIFIQFVLTISLLCTIIYFLSKQPLFTSEFTAMATFFVCILSQTFLYCWYGYKLIENSRDVVFTIYDLDWTILQKETKRMLLFLMELSSKGMVLFNNAIVNLTPETYLKMVKLSYSAFNLLKKS